MKKAEAVVAALEAHKHPHLHSLVSKAEAFLAAAKKMQEGSDAGDAAVDAALASRTRKPGSLERDLSSMLHLPELRHAAASFPPPMKELLPGLTSQGHTLTVWATVLAWNLLRQLAPTGEKAAVLFDELQLRSALAEIFTSLGLHNEQTWRAAARVRVLLAHSGDEPGTPESLSSGFWKDGDVRWLASVTEAYGSTYFNKEGFESVVSLLEIPRIVAALAKRESPAQIVKKCEARIHAATLAAHTAGYDLDAFVKATEAPAAAGVAASTSPAKAAKKTATSKSAPEAATKTATKTATKAASKSAAKAVSSTMTSREVAPSPKPRRAKPTIPAAEGTGGKTTK